MKIRLNVNVNLPTVQMTIIFNLTKFSLLLLYFKNVSPIINVAEFSITKYANQYFPINLSNTDRRIPEESPPQFLSTQNLFH